MIQIWTFWPTDASRPVRMLDTLRRKYYNEAGLSGLSGLSGPGCHAWTQEKAMQCRDDQSSIIKIRFKYVHTITDLWNPWNPKNVRMPLLTLVKSIWQALVYATVHLPWETGLPTSRGSQLHHAASSFHIVSDCFGPGKSAPAVVREPSGFKSASLRKHEKTRRKNHPNSSKLLEVMLVETCWNMNFEIQLDTETKRSGLRSLTRSHLPLLCHIATCGVQGNTSVTTLDVIIVIINGNIEILI